MIWRLDIEYDGAIVEGKSGKASVINVLGLVSIGDASTRAARLTWPTTGTHGRLGLAAHGKGRHLLAQVAPFTGWTGRLATRHDQGFKLFSARLTSVLVDRHGAERVSQRALHHA